MTFRPRVPTYFSLAPMMDKTDRHFRRFLRLISQEILLYTEMINPDAIRFGDRRRHLDHGEAQGPCVLQLGSDDPEALAEAIKIAESEGHGYDEYNLNVGCPSDRVQFRNIGACLMAQPSLVAACVAAMKAASPKPVTVKHRIGITGRNLDHQGFDRLCHFVETVRAGGADGFTIHARIAILEGLSPKENRHIPPLDYPMVHRLKASFPGVPMEINGHVRTLAHALDHLVQGMDGVMFGRVAYEDPWELRKLDPVHRALVRIQGPAYGPRVPGSGNLASQATALIAEAEATVLPLSRPEVAQTWAAYVDQVQDREGLNPRALIWPVLDLFPGLPGARTYRQILSQPISRGTSVRALMEKALKAIH